MTRALADWDFPTAVRRVIVHHSASAHAHHDAEDCRSEHIRIRHWKDLGYHFVIDRGGVALGRPLWLMGAHDAGQNADSIGVLLVGDWRTGKDGNPWESRPMAWVQLVWLCADLLDALDLPTTALEGHQQNEPRATPTLCPGFPPQRLRDAVSSERKRRRMEAPDLYPYTTDL